MLEGLEISEVRFNVLNSETNYLRIDSEFQLKEYKHSVSLISRIPHKEFMEHIGLLTDGKHGGVTLTEEGVVFLRTTNIKENQIDLSDLRFISETESNETKRAEFNEGDLLITTIGTIGLCAKVPKGFPRGTINQNLVRVVLKDKNKASVFCAFFNSKFGRNQLLRWGAGNVYQMINYPNLRLVLVPDFSETIALRIDAIYQRVFLIREQSKALYTQAETLLLDTLGMADFSPSTEGINVKSFKDSFTARGRLDAEYFYPAKESALDFLGAMSGQVVGDLFLSIRDLWQPDKAADEQVRNYDLTDALSPFLDCTKELTTRETISSTKKRLQAGDLVVSRLRSYLKEIAVVMDGSDAPMVGSTEFIVLRPKLKSLSVETLLVYLRSTLPQLILKWSQDGSNHPRFDEQELLNLRIPDAILVHDTEVTDLVKRAIAARRESQSLLEVAKRAVEITIEQDENAGLAYIKANS